MLILYFISVTIHILFAAIWFGGSVLVILLYQHESKSINYFRSDSSNNYSMIQAFRKLSWVCFFLLFVTGLYNLFVRGYSWYDLFSSEFWVGYFGETLLVKLVLFAWVLTSAIVNDYLLRNLIAGKLYIKTEETIRLFQRSLFLLRANLVLGFCILICAVMLVRGRPW
ncbi:CopD family protein [bacterium]|nr:MAG: CopD family protein [bacterium]